MLRAIQQHTAITAVGPSAMRGQGKGVMKAAQRFLGQLNLKRFSVKSEAAFRRRLDAETLILKKRFPSGSRNWGAARVNL